MKLKLTFPFDLYIYICVPFSGSSLVQESAQAMLKPSKGKKGKRKNADKEKDESGSKA